MKLRLLVTLSVAAIAVAGWSIWVDACDHDKQTSASNASAASAGSCSGHHAAAAALTASACAGHGASATTASMSASECAAHQAAVVSMTAGQCAHKTSATAASMSGSCAAHHAAAASMTADACAGHAAAAANGACRYHESVAGMLGVSCLTGMSNHAAASGCAGHGARGAEFKSADARTAEKREDCDACKDMEACAEQLSANGAQLQVVSLKNGVMFVYTTDTPQRARAIQMAMARRTERLTSLAASGDRARLCPDCKVIRGAMASGKLSRETQNIDGGCITLMTSNDAAVVAKLHSMAGASSSGRTKI